MLFLPSMIHFGRAIPIVVDCGPSGWLYLIKFSLIFSSVKLRSRNTRCEYQDS